jgi:hypothetical protein
MIVDAHFATNIDVVAIDDLTAGTRFLETWDSEGYPAVFDNEPPIDEPHGKVWARLSVQPTTRRLSINARTYESSGASTSRYSPRKGWQTMTLGRSQRRSRRLFRDWKSADLAFAVASPNIEPMIARPITSPSL